MEEQDKRNKLDEKADVEAHRHETRTASDEKQDADVEAHQFDPGMNDPGQLDPGMNDPGQRDA